MIDLSKHKMYKIKIKFDLHIKIWFDNDVYIYRDSQFNVLHNPNGPSVISNGNKYYYINNQKIGYSSVNDDKIFLKKYIPELIEFENDKEFRRYFLLRKFL